MINFVNYIVMAIGIITVLAASILILFDKLKGEDIYFNIDVKEQEIKKVMEDADDVISEINYISEVVVKEIEDKISSLQEVYKAAKVLNIPTYEQIVQQPHTAPQIFVQQANGGESYIEKKPAAVEIEVKPTMNENKKTPSPLTKEAYEKKANKSGKETEDIDKCDKSNTKQKSVFDYAAQGLSIPEIAKKMNMGQGEVMLILSIKNEV